MDLQTRKLNAIGFLLGIQDETILSKIELTISEFQNKKLQDLDLKPFSEEQLIERARLSNQDYLAGRFMDQDQLEKNIRDRII